MRIFKKIALLALIVCLTCSALLVGCADKNSGGGAPSEVVKISESNPVMPVAFLSDVEYQIPQAVFVDDSGKKISYSVYMTDETGLETKLNGNTFTPRVLVHGKNITLKYVAGEKVKQYSVPVLKATSIQNNKTYYSFDKMFVTSNVESSALTDVGTVFYGSRDFSATFANPLEASFSIHVKSLEGFANFESVSITVTDFVDNNVKAVLTISPNEEGNSLLSVNGGDPMVMKGSLKDFEDGFKLNFNANTQKIFDIENTEVGKITSTIDGKPFDGFKSQRVNLTIGITSPRATSAVSIVNVNNQTMTTSASRDRISPFVVCGEDIVIINNLKDKITIPKALAFDVLDPSVTTMVSVFAPDGNIAKTSDGKEFFELDAQQSYQFTAQSLGEYAIQYTAIDSNGNKYGNGWYSVFIVDNKAPSLTVKSPVKDTVTIGTEITISQLDYSDDCSKKEDIDVLITVHFANGDYKVVNPGDKFKFEMVGTYYFRYTVIDEFYNMNTVSQTVECK